MTVGTELTCWGRTASPGVGTDGDIHTLPDFSGPITGCTKSWEIAGSGDLPVTQLLSPWHPLSSMTGSSLHIAVAALKPPSYLGGLEQPGVSTWG